MNNISALLVTYLEARDQYDTTGRRPPAALRAMQSALLEVLKTDATLPRAMHDDLVAALTTLLAGNAPDLLAPLAPEVRAESPEMRARQEAAVRYLRWVQAGHVADADARATVAGYFGVLPAQVEDWLSAWQGLVVTVHEDCRADDVVRQMKIAGRQYRALKASERASERASGRG